MEVITNKRKFILLLFFGIIINTSLSQMMMRQFENFIEKKCYDREDSTKGELGIELVYGQEYPLAHTLENFLNLVEKYELANPEKSMQEVTGMLLRNYTFENLMKEGGFTRWTAPSTSYANMEKYWKRKLQIENTQENMPYDDDEICSLYFMLSHTVNDTAWSSENYYSVQFDGGNGETISGKKSETPREHGVVSIGMTDHTVALGRVISGIYLALLGNFNDKLSEWVSEENKPDLPNANAEINSFYALTIDDMLALISWNSQTAEMTGKGKWSFVPTINTDLNMDTKDIICPNVYRLQDKDAFKYTYSSLRGAIDGIILGNALIENSNLKDHKLSQILRMYYSKRGIEVSQKKEDGVVSICRRLNLIQKYAENIKNDLTNSIFILSNSINKNKNKDGVAWSNYETLLSNNDFKGNEDLDNGICGPPSNADVPCETPHDVIAVLDTTHGQEYLSNQQIILGHLANKLHLWHQGSKLTVLLDKRNDTSHLGLEALIDDSSSSTSAACRIIQQKIDVSSGTDREFIIQSIDKFLQDRKAEEKDLNGAPGKILIYFNFGESEPKSSKLDKVLTELYLHHQDTTIYAVGKDTNTLLKYARKNENNAIFGTEADLKQLAEDLSIKICERPAALKFEDCVSPRNERGAYFDGLITPNTIQHWSMEPKYFVKSYTAKIFVELDDTDGEIKVCHNRADHPEISNKTCQMLKTGVRTLEYSHINPCKGFSVTTCSPMTFSLIGFESQDQMQSAQLCEDKENSNCKRLDQIRFKVYHEGIRCSGCSGLSSTLLIMVITVIISFFMS